MGHCQRGFLRCSRCGDLAVELGEHKVAAVPIVKKCECVMTGDEGGLAHANGFASPLTIMAERPVENGEGLIDPQPLDERLCKIAQEEILLKGNILHRGDDPFSACDVFNKAHFPAP